MTADFFNYMGKPIPGTTKMKATMWLVDDVGMSFEEAVATVDEVSVAMAADRPDLAQKLGMRSRLDLTGYFRLAAILLAGVAEAEAAAA